MGDGDEKLLVMVKTVLVRRSNWGDFVDGEAEMMVIRIMRIIECWRW